MKAKNLIKCFIIFVSNSINFFREKKVKNKVVFHLTINYIEGGRWWNYSTQKGGRYRFDGWKRFVPFIDNYTYF